MDGIRIELDNAEVLALEKKLLALSVIRLDGVLKLNIKEIFDRAQSGGTPVDTGELRNTSLQTCRTMRSVIQKITPRMWNTATAHAAAVSCPDNIT